MPKTIQSKQSAWYRVYRVLTEGEDAAAAAGRTNQDVNEAEWNAVKTESRRKGANELHDVCERRAQLAKGSLIEARPCMLQSLIWTCFTHYRAEKSCFGLLMSCVGIGKLCLSHMAG